jgi:hypothetical protein
MYQRQRCQFGINQSSTTSGLKVRWYISYFAGFELTLKLHSNASTSGKLELCCDNKLSIA